jgi:hypothetical protein
MNKLLVVSMCLVLIACQTNKGHTPLSKRFLHKSTEAISDDETVEVYHDLVNDNTCYFYYFSDQKDAVALACVVKPPTIY